jgi:hypothetical protein
MGCHLVLPAVAPTMVYLSPRHRGAERVVIPQVLCAVSPRAFPHVTPCSTPHRLLGTSGVVLHRQPIPLFAFAFQVLPYVSQTALDSSHHRLLETSTEG